VFHNRRIKEIDAFGAAKVRPFLELNKKREREKCQTKGFHQHIIQAGEKA